MTWFTAKEYMNKQPKFNIWFMAKIYIYIKLWQPKRKLRIWFLQYMTVIDKIWLHQITKRFKNTYIIHAHVTILTKSSIYLFFMSVYLPVYLTVSLSIYLSIWLSVSIISYFTPSIYLSVYQSITLPVYPRTMKLIRVDTVFNLIRKSYYHSILSYLP